MEKSKDVAIAYVKGGGKSFYRYGFAFKGAGMRPITKEDALRKLDSPQWSFGTGFYELEWEKKDGEDVLVFNEYSENDML